jgi:hypothetical protein
MASSGMLRRVTLLRTDVSEELSASTIKMTRISQITMTLAVTSNRRLARNKLIRRSRESEIITNFKIFKE